MRSSYCNAVGWALVIELGMMIGPPVAPMAVLFGHRPHVAAPVPDVPGRAHRTGIMIGLLTQHFLDPEDEGWLIPVPIR